MLKNTGQLRSVVSRSSGEVLFEYHGGHVAFSRSGRFVAYDANSGTDQEGTTICVRQTRNSSAAPVCIKTPKGFRFPVFAVSDRHLAAAAIADKLDGSYDMAVRLWRVEDGQLERLLERDGGWVQRMEFSADSSSLLIAGYTLSEWREIGASGSDVVFNYAGPGASAATYTPKDDYIVAGYDSGIINLFRRGSQNAITTLESQTGGVEAIAVNDGEGRFGGLFLSGAMDGTIKAWRLSECAGNESPSSPCKPLFSLLQLATNRWLLTNEQGRFESNSLEEEVAASWKMFDDPMRALPIEIFMRDYFEPRLLPRILAGEKFAQLPPLDKLNRVQPLVKVVSVEPERSTRSTGDAEPDTVQVTVEVAGDSREFGLEGNKRRMTTGVYDLRLFRDGQVVEQWPPESAAASAPQLSREQELEQWRKDHRIVEFIEGANKPKRIVFKGIRLPRLAGKDKVEFSAYAFNVDRVKSETAKWPYDLPKGLKPRVPRAYIVTIGVNAFEDEAWDLKYAANDARQAGSELKKRLEAVLAPNGSNQYDKVVWIPLISDAIKEAGKPRQVTLSKANKKQIEAVLKTLAGQAVDAQALSGIESAGDLRRVNPEDLVIIVMSTHGTVDDRGTFYFLPADIGREFLLSKATDAATKARMLAQAVSSDELTQWLRGLDAVDQVMIIDACHSAASVQNAEFKPGPMGSRGLGQLAYDKGMRILAATQVDQDAIDGTDTTKMGLLIYALIEDGLRAGKAAKNGRIMLSEWLNYASQRVPAVFQGIQDGTIKGTRGTVEYSPDGKTDAARRASLQQPSLFDFARGRDLFLAIETTQH